MGKIEFIIAVIITGYIMYQYKTGDIDKCILGSVFGFGLLFEHHINRIIDILNK